jgi:hypothetical protein
MEPNKTNENIGGYNLANLLNTSIGSYNKNKVVTLSFKIHDIIHIDNTEIMKLIFFNGITVRLMKYANDDNNPVATFDLIDEEKKEILTKSDKEYIGGLGLADTFFKMNYITQWEIPTFTTLCRSFVLGDVETIKDLISHHHLKFSKESEWHLKNELGIDT